MAGEMAGALKGLPLKALSEKLGSWWPSVRQDPEQMDSPKVHRPAGLACRLRRNTVSDNKWEAPEELQALSSPPHV